jgi:phosphoribosylamine--glycine ligase
MGAYAPTSQVDAALQREIEDTVIRPTLAGLKADGIDYRGTLYAGLMLTDKGVRVLEYNVRFGDPETQVLLPMVADDLLPVLLAAARGEALPPKLSFHEGACLLVVMAAEGYPGAYATGRPISLPREIPDGAAVVHAGTTIDQKGQLVTAGGRVLGIRARGSDIQAAAQLAYSVADRVAFEGRTFRRDIGHRELNR